MVFPEIESHWLTPLKIQIDWLFFLKLGNKKANREFIPWDERIALQSGSSLNDERRRSTERSEITMAARLKAAYVGSSEDFRSNAKIVKFRVVEGHQEHEAAQEQELASFETLMLPHLDAAYNLARWLLRNEDDARDVVQEAYLRAFKSFGGFHGSNGRPWLLTIVRNTAYSLIKKNQSVPVTTTFDEEEYLVDRESVSPATQLEHSEASKLVREAIDRLPEEFREILVLRHLEGLSYKEIADVAHLAPGTVMSRLARARGKLKEFLKTDIGKEI